MSNLVSKDSIIDLVKKTSIKVLRQCENHYDPEIDDYVYDDVREVDILLKLNKAIQVAINNMESEHELISRKEAIKQQKIGEWNMFILLSSAWYGKQCYFEEDNDNEIIYSKFSGKLMSREEAIKEFIREISE